MDDRDTAKAAADDLLSILHNMDQDTLPIVLSCICTTGAEHKVYARKECARALGVIASAACPLREQALQQPHLNKMLGQLRRSLQDADSGVRDASAEALAQLARGLAEVGLGGVGGGAGGGASPASNPVLRVLLECLVEQKRELNAAACAALGMAAPWLGTLDGSVARELARKLNAGTFQAPAALLAALARTEPSSGEPVGLLRSGPAAFVPILSSLLGQPAQPAGSGGTAAASGVIGALSRTDWPVRLAAADMLRATALLLGPLMEVDGCWGAGEARCLTGRALRGLESCRFDKVREVRDVARAALAVMQELLEYGAAGGGAAGWPAHIAERLIARGLPVPISPAPSAPPPLPPPGRKSPLRRSSPGPGPGPALAPRRRLASPSPDAERRPSPLALARDSSLAQRFRGAHRNGEIAVHDPFGPVDFAAMEAEEAAAAVAGGGAGTEAEEGGGSRAPSRRLSHAISSSSRGTQEARALASQGPEDGRQPRQPDEAGLGEDDDLPLTWDDSDGPPTFAQQISEAARAVADDLEGDAGPAPDQAPDPAAGPGLSRRGSHASGRSSGPPTAPIAAWPAPSALAAAPAAAAATAAAAGSTAAAALDSLGPTVTLPTEEWLAAQERLRGLEAQQRELLDAFSALSEQSSAAISGLQAKVRSLEAALEAANARNRAGAPPDPSPQPLQQQQQPQDQHQHQPHRPGSGVGEPQAQAEPRPSDEPEAEAGRPSLMRTIRPGSPLVLALAGGGPGGGADVASPRVSVQLPPASPAFRASQDVSGGGASSSGDGYADARQAYREALSGGRPGDMHLLRLLQRTGPIWNELGHELACRLLAAFTASLQQPRADGPMLSRILPWLWRLADDEHNRFVAPQDMRAALLAALRSAQPLVADAKLHERMELLTSTLHAHWGLPTADPWDTSRPASQSEGAPTQRLQSSYARAAASPSPAPGSVETTPRPHASTAAAGTAPHAASAPCDVGADGASASGATPLSALPPKGDGIPTGVGGTQDDADRPPSPERASVSPVPGGGQDELAAQRMRAPFRAMTAPSNDTLMGQLSVLQRDLAAMPSPAKAQGGRRGC